MSYQLIEIKIENYARLVTNATPLYVPLGALSPNDMTTLKVSVTVGSFAGVGTADMTLEESMDGGVTWAAITTATNGPISTTATYSVWVTDDTGIPSPNLRLKILPAAGVTLYATKVFRTFTTGDVIIPRSSVNVAMGDTETKLDTLITNSEQWPYAAHNALTYSWDAGTFTEVITYKTGGTGGTTVGTITNVFTDVTKATPVSTVYSPAVKVGG
jgi:hypothetical protein